MFGRRLSRLARPAALATLSATTSAACESSGYRLPPPEIVELADAEPVPSASIPAPRPPRSLRNLKGGCGGAAPGGIVQAPSRGGPRARKLSDVHHRVATKLLQATQPELPGLTTTHRRKSREQIYGRRRRR